MANYENVCSYGESLSETLRKLKEDVNKMKWWGWRPQGGITIARRSEFYAGQKMQKTAEKCNYDYDIVWAFARNLTKARREFRSSNFEGVECTRRRSGATPDRSLFQKFRSLVHCTGNDKGKRVTLFL